MQAENGESERELRTKAVEGHALATTGVSVGWTTSPQFDCA